MEPREVSILHHEVSDEATYMNYSTSEELKSLLTVLSVTDVRALDSDHLEDRLEDWCSDMGTRRQTNHNDGSSGSDIFGSLLEGFLVDGHEDDSVGSEAVLSGCSNIFRDVARFGKVNECLCQVSDAGTLFTRLSSYACTHLLAHGLLVIS